MRVNKKENERRLCEATFETKRSVASTSISELQQLEVLTYDVSFAVTNLTKL